MSDNIDKLPVIKTERMSALEASRLRPYISEKKPKSFFQKYRKFIILLATFVALSIPIVGAGIGLLTNSWIWTLVIKTVVFAVVLIVIFKLDV
jgi:hypothetical protein